MACTLAREWHDEEEGEMEPSIIRQLAIPLSEMPRDHRLGILSIDVQLHHLSCHVWIFGPKWQALLVERKEFHGDVEHENGLPWQALRAWVLEREHWNGRRMDLACIDMAYKSDVVMNAATRIGHRRVFPVKGFAGWDKPVFKRSETRIGNNSRRIYSLGTDAIKVSAVKGLRAGTIRICDHLEEEVEAELCAERLVWRGLAGRRYRKWDKPHASKNECFDSLVYAMASVRISGATDSGIVNMRLPDAVAEPQRAPSKRKRKRFGGIAR